LVRDVAAIGQPLAANNGKLLVAHGPEVIGKMRADQTKVRQALFNLLSNAAKFNDHGTIELRVARAEGRGPTRKHVARAHDATGAGCASSASRRSDRARPGFVQASLAPVHVRGRLAGSRLLVGEPHCRASPVRVIDPAVPANAPARQRGRSARASMQGSLTWQRP
jgi:signal transduction histidine kinase